jgi:hypothetical protein
MNIYKISQSENNYYDTFDSAIVAAESEEEARLINPDGEWYEKQLGYKYTAWAYRPEKVKVEYLGTAKENTESGVILASFNAG